jgi:hypothetical protein
LLVLKINLLFFLCTHCIVSIFSMTVFILWVSSCNYSLSDCELPTSVPVIPVPFQKKKLLRRPLTLVQCLSLLWQIPLKHAVIRLLFPRTTGSLALVTVEDTNALVTLEGSPADSLARARESYTSSVLWSRIHVSILIPTCCRGSIVDLQ